MPDEGSCARFGMVAVEDIADQETIFSIARTAVLSPTTSRIHELLSKGKVLALRFLIIMMSSLGIFVI